jgi:exodeoxyribonuclease VII small subunit
MAKPSRHPTTTPLSPSTSGSDTPPTYETAYARLETVLAQLESGDLPLEASLALYEEGAQLAKICATLLDEAELRVRQWQPGDETTAFDDWSDGAGE